MQALRNKLHKGQKKLEYSSIMVTYHANDGMWRGFVVPFDITFEAETKEEVLRVLRQMIDAYVDGLKEYGNPDHLSTVPLSHPEDKSKWDSICVNVMENLLKKTKRKFETPDYYVEAQLPA